MFASEPVSRLSRQMTRCPFPRSASQRCEPRKPAPPVTSEVGIAAMLPASACRSGRCLRSPHRPQATAPVEGWRSGLSLLASATWSRRPRTGSLTADAADPRGRPLGRASRRRARGHGRERRRRAPGHRRPLSLRRRRLRGGRRAGVGLLRPRRAAPWSGRAGHRAALRDREPAARRPVVVRRAALGRPRPGDPRRGLRRDDRRSRGRTPSRRRRSGSATRRARRPIRTSPTSLRSPTTATSTAATSTTRGLSTRRTAGATSSRPTSTWTRTASSRRSRATTGREAGQAIYENGCEPPEPPTPKPVVPILECVEQLDGGGFLAHWGYDNKNGTTVEPPSDENKFSPGAGGPRPADGVRGGPRRGRLPGRVRRLRAHVVAHRQHGDGQPGSTTCPGGSITITKRLVPKDDPGRFALRIDGEVAGGAAAVGDGGSTGTIAVATGSRTVSETAAAGTKLGDYTIETVCRNGDRVVASSDGIVGQGRRRSRRRDRLHHHEQRGAATARASPPRSTASSSRTAPTTSRTGAIATAA